MRSNSLRRVGQHHGGRLSDPEEGTAARRPGTVRHLQCRKSRARFRSSTARASIRAACTSCGSATANTSTWRPARRTSNRPIRSDDQFYRMHRRAQSVEADRSRPLVDARHPAGRQRAAAAAAIRSTRATARTTPTSIRSGRTGCYLGYIDGGMFVMDISDKSQPEARSRHWTNSPPYTGFMHTVVPLFDRGLMLVDRRVDREQRQGLAEADLGARRARREQPRCRSRPARCRRSTPMRVAAAGSARTTSTRTCRCRRAWQSDQVVLGTFFNGGLRAYDISNPYQPKEDRHLRAAGAAGVAGRHDPAQRRVRRRARDRLHGRPPHRRPVYPGDVISESQRRRPALCRASAALGVSAADVDGRDITRAVITPVFDDYARRMTSDHERDFPLHQRRPVRPPAEARARRQGAGDRASPAFSAPGRPRWCSAFWKRPRAPAPPSSSTNSARPASTTRWCAPAPTRRC